MKKFYLAFLIVLVGNIIHYSIWFQFLGFSFSHPFDDDGDSAQYIGATESLIEKGELTYFHLKELNYLSNYVDQSKDDLGILYAFRTPGFNFIHYPLRLFFDYKNSLIIFLIFQIIFSTLAKVTLAYLIWQKSKLNSATFWIIIFLFFIDFQFSYLNNFLLTESMGGSFFVFSLFFLVNGFSFFEEKKNFLFAGLLLATAIFFRPFLIVFIIVYFIYLTLNLSKSNMKWKNIGYFFLPLIIIFGIWSIRNYSLTNEFIPISTTMRWNKYTNRAFISNFEICQNNGLSYEWWSIESPMFWLMNKKDNRKPSLVYGEIGRKYEMEFLKAKILYAKSVDKSINIESRKFNESRSSEIFEKITEDLSKNKYNYFLKSRINSSIRLIFSKPLNPFISIKYPVNYLFLLLELFLNRLIFILGGIGCLVLFFQNINKNIFFMYYSSIPLGLFGLFAIVLLSTEQREMFIVELFLLPIVGYLLSKLIYSKRWILLTLVFLSFSLLSIIESFNYIKF
jgi:hypothetical protein